MCETLPVLSDNSSQSSIITFVDKDKIIPDNYN